MEQKLLVPWLDNKGRMRLDARINYKEKGVPRVMVWVKAEPREEWQQRIFRHHWAPILDNIHAFIPVEKDKRAAMLRAYMDLAALKLGHPYRARSAALVKTKGA